MQNKFSKFERLLDIGISSSGIDVINIAAVNPTSE